MGPMIMGLWDDETNLWGTMELWDTTHHAPRTTHCASARLRIVKNSLSDAESKLVREFPPVFEVFIGP